MIPLLGIAAGLAWVGGAGAVNRLLGGSSAAALAGGAVAAAALAWGLRRGARSATASRPGDCAGAGVPLALLGLLSVLAGFAASGSAVLRWVGVGLEAGAPSAAIGRILLSGVFLAPAGLAAAAAVHAWLRPRPEGAVAPRTLAAAAALAATAALAGRIAPLATPAETWRLAAWSGGALFLIASVLARRRRAAAAAPAEATSSDGTAPPAGAGPVAGPAPRPDARTRDADPARTWPAGLAIGFGAFAFRVLGERLFEPAFGNELPGLPVAAAAAATGLAVGAALAVPFARRPGPDGGRAAALLAALAAAVALAGLGRWGTWPAAFVAAAAQARDLDAVLETALRLAVPHLAPPALLLGAAGGLLVASVPAERRRRPAWLAAAGSAFAAGAVLGEGWARLAPLPLGLDRTLLGAALATASLAAAAIALRPGRPLARATLAAAPVVIVALVARATPPTDRSALLVEASLASTGIPGAGAPGSWLEFDEEDGALSAALLRRGYARRLLVHGRFDSSNETTARTQGMLAHLPLLLHPAPRRLLAIGAGTGTAPAAAIAHPLERIDVVEVGRAAVRAAVRMGPASRAAFEDGRVYVRVGDPEDLLGRASPYDVILLQASGAWSDRSSRTCTREFLERVRGRLAEGGIACQWIPDSALTRDGLLALLATWAHVFPQVECWAGCGGAVLVLAKRDAAPHDFERVLAAYREPRIAAACEASWIATPETLLSRFLVNDASVRRLTARAPVHARGNGELARREVARRRSTSTVDPVPGLARIRDDAAAAFVRTPEAGFAAAIRRATAARDLEREGADLELSGRRDEAIAAYRRAIELNPRDGAARRAFAALRSLQGVQFGERQALFAAHGYLREAVETDTTYAQGFANLGLLLFQAEDLDYAVACTGQAIALAPDDDLFHLQMARIWKFRGYYDKAVQYALRARELNPLSVEAGLLWVDSKMAMEGDAPDLRAALDRLEEYRAIAPRHPELLARIRKVKTLMSRAAARSGAPADSVRPDAP
jgi:spermidine synthase